MSFSHWAIINPAGDYVVFVWVDEKVYVDDTYVLWEKMTLGRSPISKPEISLVNILTLINFVMKTRGGYPVQTENLRAVSVENRRLFGSTGNFELKSSGFSGFGFPCRTGIFRAVPVKKLRFFPVQPKNMRAVTPVTSKTGWPSWWKQLQCGRTNICA